MDRKETFVVHIISQENATWQGQITWVGKKEAMYFRSFLELVKLVDNAMTEEEDSEFAQVVLEATEG